VSLLHLLLNVERFRESRAKGPIDARPDFKPGVFNRTHQAMMGSVSTKRQQQTAGEKGESGDPLLVPLLHLDPGHE